MKLALGYVLTNVYKHRGKRGWIARSIYSSAVTVAKETWKALLGKDWGKMLDPCENAPAGRISQDTLRGCLESGKANAFNFAKREV